MPSNYLSPFSAARLTFAILILAVVGCQNSQGPAIKTFPSLEEAGATLVAAAKDREAFFGSIGHVRAIAVSRVSPCEISLPIIES